ncbi:dipeptidase [Mycolicibacterium nivoides]|uniref:Dipeptidase n=1 Tax=Mycolicibacterium nivoides TaxID=2487344 RepID=A0ABW9LK12_9MYCO
MQAFKDTPVVDGHNDLAFAARVAAGYSVENLATGAAAVFQTDIDRLRRGGVGAQFWSVYAPSDLAPAEALKFTMEQIDFVYRLIERYEGDLAFARTSDDVRAAWRNGRIASLIGAEGGACIGESLGVLRMLARLGVRYMTLTHDRNVAWADSATDEPEHHGLNVLGRSVVQEMNRVGMLVDLSHVSAETMRDAIATSEAPVIFSHSSCHHVCPHPRNVPDDVLKLLSNNGGVLMIAFVAPFVSREYNDWSPADSEHPRPRATVDDVVAHFNHAREVCGIDHIGLGSDYDGFDEWPDEMSDVRGFAVLLDRLAAQGWSSTDLSKVMGGNLLRVLGDTDVAASSACK